ncbi:MAG: hypothetical protein LBS69_07410 [Prevotellaceae bacterium]|jgi:hypothetical protein|nr:hypothetical protein [Prevotellaceae bacterium]
MKQTLKFWSLATLVALCVGFSSCSDDEEEGGSFAQVEFYVDGELMYLDSGGSRATHTIYTDDPDDGFFDMQLLFKKGDHYYGFDLEIYNINNMNLVSAGDDISNLFDGIIHTDGTLYGSLSYDGFYNWHKSYPGYPSTYGDPGTVIVENIDTKNQIITIKLDGVQTKKLSSTGSTSYYHELDAKIKMHYNIYTTTHRDN